MTFTKGAVSAEPEGFLDDDDRADLNVHGLVDWTGNRAGWDGGNFRGSHVLSKPFAWPTPIIPPAKRMKELCVPLPCLS